MDGVVFYINVIIDYECAFDYRNMIIDLSGGSKKYIYIYIYIY
jgi:hypothetical protein